MDINKMGLIPNWVSYFASASASYSQTQTQSYSLNVNGPLPQIFSTSDYDSIAGQTNEWVAGQRLGPASKEQCFTFLNYK